PLPDGEPPGLDRLVADAEAGRRAERDLRLPDGRVVTLHVAPLGQACPPSLLLVVVDRTSERHREEVERRFIANASHELRTPLSAIAAAVEVLESGAKDDPVARDAFLADVRREATRLGRLTDTLLTVARLGTGELR